MKFAVLLLVIVRASSPLSLLQKHSPPEVVPIQVAASADRFHTVWYFFSDVYPSLHDGQRPLDPPSWWRRIFEGRAVETDVQPINNDIAAAAAPEVR